MEAIILAGGKGARLQSVVKDVPKPMADINGRPFLSHLLDYLSVQNINKIFLSVGYKHEIIMNYFGAQYKDMDIEYIIEEKPLGTGGAIKKALKLARGDEVITLNGDTFFNLDLEKMLGFHRAENSILTIAVKPMYDFERYGSVAIKDKRVVGFEEKSFKQSGYINGGIYIMNKAILKLLEQEHDIFSFEVDFLHKRINNICPFAFISDDYFVDIGIPEDYEKAKKGSAFSIKAIEDDYFKDTS